MAEQNGKPSIGVPAPPAMDPNKTVIITLSPDGKLNLSVPPDEIMGRFLLSKAGSVMDDIYKARARGPANRIIPVN